MNDNSTKTESVASQLNEALAGNFILVDFSARIWEGRKVDKAAGLLVTQGAGAVSDAGKFMKALFAGSDAELKAVKSAYQAVRTFVYANTMPFSSASGHRRGPRLLATKQSIEFMKRYNVMQHDAARALAELQQVYPQRVQEAVGKLGSLGHVDEYPDVSELANMFDLRIDFTPVPAMSSFKNMALPPQVADFFVDRMRKRQESAVASALLDIKQRITEELLRITKQLSKHADGEKVRLYKSLVGNIKRLNDILRASNVAGNTELDQLCDDIDSKLCKYDIEQVKNNVTVAKTMAVDAADLSKALDTIELF